jgi:DNA polymerase III alpha subunit
MQNFITPHCHPQSLDSASTPEAFAKKEKELGTGVITCTDHGSLAAVCKVAALAKKYGLIAIPGLEAYFRDDSCPILTKLGVMKTDDVPRGCDKDKWELEHPTGNFVKYNKYYHLTLGFRDYNAYLKSVKLLSNADDRAERHGSERKPLFDWNDIEEIAATNTTLGSGCLVGMVSRHLIKQDSTVKLAAAKAYFERLLHLFKDRFFIEVFPHVCSHNYVSGVFVTYTLDKNNPTPVIQKYYTGKLIKTLESGEITTESLAKKWNSKNPQTIVAVKNYRVWEDLPSPRYVLDVVLKNGFFQNECSPASPDGDIQWGVNKFMMGMAKKYNIPILISDDSHFCDASQKIVQDVKLAQMDKWDSGSSWRFYESYHRQTSAEAYAYFNKQHNIQEKEFESWVDNAKQWADGFKNFKFDNTVQLPTKFFPKDTLAYTKELIQKYGRMPKNDPRYMARLKQEIELFHNNGVIDLLPYFWIDEEINRIYANQGILTGCGRGSAAGVLLSYLIGVTAIDPIKYDLSLDRFLTKDRIKSGKYPDIDLDFPSRDLLCGQETSVVEVEAEDGSKHVLPKDFKIETDQGVLTIQEAVEKQASFKEWWPNTSDCA